MCEYFRFEGEILHKSWQDSLASFRKHLVPEIFVTIASFAAGLFVNPIDTMQGFSGAFLISATAVGLMFLSILIGHIVSMPYRMWKKDHTRLEEFEEAEKPKLDFDLIQTTNPKGASGLADRSFVLKITNDSSTQIIGCHVVQKSLINANGHKSDSDGQRFKLRCEQPLIIPSHIHQQSFDLAPREPEYVSIAGIDETSQDSNVIMLYAARGAASEQIKNSIPRELFPHQLVLQICAENIPNPQELTYQMDFEDGKFIFIQE